MNAGLTKDSKRKRNMASYPVTLVGSVVMGGSWRAGSHPRDPVRYRKGVNQ